MELRSIQRNAELLQQLAGLEAKIKESTLKTERLKLQREKALREAQDAMHNHEAKRIRQLDNCGPLTSTPHQYQSPYRTCSGTSQMSSTKVYETLRDGSKGLPNLPRPKTTEAVPHFSSGGSSLRRNAQYTDRSFLSPNPRIPKKVEFSKAPVELNFNDADISEITEYNPYKTSSKQSKILNVKSKDLYAGWNEDMEYSDDEIHATRGFNAKTASREHAEIVNQSSVKAESTRNNYTIIRSELITKTDILAQKTLTKSNSPETPVIPKILSNSELLTRADMPTKKEISKDVAITSQVKADDQEIAKEEIIVVGSQPARKLEMPTIADSFTGAITLMKEDVLAETKNSTQVEIPLEAKHESKQLFQKPEIVISSEIKTIYESNTSVTPKTDAESSRKMEITSNTEMPLEKMLPQQFSTEFSSTLSEIPENAKVKNNKKIVKELAIEDTKSEKESQPADLPIKILDISETMEIEKSSGNEAAAVSTEMKKQEGILSFLSSDEDDDDDDDDSFFDSIPKPNAMEPVSDSRVKHIVPPSAEESSETLSEDDEGDTGHQLANLVASPLVKFVEHEIVQSEHDSYGVANLPPESPKTKKIIKDSIAQRSTESGLASQPFQEQSEKQPHQKLAMHLGLDSKIAFKKSESDVKDRDQVDEEDDFDFYD